MNDGIVGCLICEIVGAVVGGERETRRQIVTEQIGSVNAVGVQWVKEIKVKDIFGCQWLV